MEGEKHIHRRLLNDARKNGEKTRWRRHVQENSKSRARDETLENMVGKVRERVDGVLAIASAYRDGSQRFRGENDGE